MRCARAILAPRTILVAMSLCTLLACRSRALRVDDYPKRLGASEYAWTELDHLRAGLAEAEKLSRSPRFSPFFDKNHTLSPRFQAGVVRIEARREVADGKWTSGLGSGLAFDAGGGLQVLTAGHVVGPPRPDVKYYATFEAGDQLAMISLPHPRPAVEADVAWLQLEAPENAPARALAATTARPHLRPARRGEPIVVVGYPRAMIGLDGAGTVRWSPPHGEVVLKPLYVLGDVEAEAPLRLRFRGGVVPTGGMSGAPVWGADGALLGVLVRISQEGQDGIYQFRGDCDPVAPPSEEQL